LKPSAESLNVSGVTGPTSRARGNAFDERLEHTGTKRQPRRRRFEIRAQALRVRAAPAAVAPACLRSARDR
jgi:hypothetical protein